MMTNERDACVPTDALRKLGFSANSSDHKGASGSRLRADLGGRAMARRADALWRAEVCVAARSSHCDGQT